MLRISALAVEPVTRIPSQLFQVFFRVTSVVVHTRRARPAGILPLRSRRQVEVQPRSCLNAPNYRIWSDRQRIRPVVRGHLSTKIIPENILQGPHISFIPRRIRIRSQQQLVLLLCHLENATVERFRDRNGTLAILFKSSRLDQTKCQLRRLIFVRIKSTLRRFEEISDRIAHCIHPNRKVDDAIRRKSFLIRHYEHRILQVERHPLRVHIPNDMVRSLLHFRVAG